MPHNDQIQKQSKKSLQHSLLSWNRPKANPLAMSASREVILVGMEKTGVSGGLRLLPILASGSRFL